MDGRFWKGIEEEFNTGTERNGHGPETRQESP